jgi:hypothetical protein
MGDINDKINFLFKKFVGVPNAFQDAEFYSEIVGNARMKIFSNQILQQKIPDTAPTDLTQDTTFVSLNGGGKRYCSTLYPYIVKYENLVLAEISPLRSYKYSLTNNATENLTNNSIPFNYDQLTSTYDTNVYDKDNNKITESDRQYSWIFDGDVGCLYFVGPADFINGPPSITFWRYEGVIGLDNIASSTGGTTSSGIGPTGLKGDTGTRGDTGPTGSKGDTGPTGSKGDTGPTGSKGDTGPTGSVDYTVLAKYGNLDSSNIWIGNNYFNAILDISDNSTRVATTQFVNNKIDAVIGASQSTIDSINTLKNSLSDISGNVLASIATTYAPINSAQLTGKPTLVIDASNTIQDSETTRIATVGYVLEKVGSGSGSGNSDWYNTYLVNQPPPVVFDASSAIITSSAIYFKFSYPNHLLTIKYRHARVLFYICIQKFHLFQI